ncbi:MAG: N-acetyl-gamma-glutamyl-phosphate reductase [Anaerolineae bacterium]|nr:N-acetyl-gamma-glutamyl-phosphate reductase [Anaerolineae bacterium]
MTKTIRVGVYGASGYARQDLIQILSEHPNVELIFATSNTYAGEFVPATDLRYIPSANPPLENVDAIFLALPHKASAPIAKKGLDAGLKVIDLSADLRLDSAEAYEKWYEVEHPHPEMLPVPYGLPELHRDKIAGVQAVAVPGCYPTATLLGLYPLLRIEGLSLDAPIIVDAKSGVTGAGRTPTDKTHFVEAYGNIVPYNAGRAHRHVGEIEQEIHKFMDISEPLIFTPHLVPIDRGLMTSIYVSLGYALSSDKVDSLYANVYADEPMVRLMPLGSHAQFKGVVKTNRCHISITPVTDRYIHITSVIDNLRKGASGQAVQCFNLMFDLPETEALL